ncbi:hypothetical protein ABB37_08630 [Leptomonas pyrrhocoris]|uniref:Uncharacterized protein n=1 Tax=Leptomonas pyrrhocoris TaxID=157538 RepID=A0A0M9FSY2_LEPPY|nr:hypothetical protein ABB37_08630 [Leptomonas pyrrhocoris]KPA75337.1 hypothetical protein ABB37_08630 [Leptomonas pyrrhocoris]|eukprot:XP_015653776.1 hypothetical protein ABB37_08630 [Leptomonas pyrrhocoris]
MGDEDNTTALEPQDKALLRMLARRLKEHARHFAATSAAALSGAEVTGDGAETEEEMLLRVKRLLLHGYSDAEWETLKRLDHGVT